jgi:hypothetical protein
MCFSLRKLVLLVGRGQGLTTARDSPVGSEAVFSHHPQCRNDDILGRFSAGATLKAALAKV